MSAPGGSSHNPTVIAPIERGPARLRHPDRRRGHLCAGGRLPRLPRDVLRGERGLRDVGRGVGRPTDPASCRRGSTRHHSWSGGVSVGTSPIAGSAGRSRRHRQRLSTRRQTWLLPPPRGPHQRRPPRLPPPPPPPHTSAAATAATPVPRRHRPLHRWRNLYLLHSLNLLHSPPSPPTAATPAAAPPPLP